MQYFRAMKRWKYTCLSLLLINLMAAGTVALGMPASSRSSSIKTQSSEVLGKAPQKSWSGSLRTGMSKNQDEYSDWFSSTSASFSRTLFGKTSFSASTSYSQPVSDDQDRVKRYGIGDLNFSLSFAELYRFNDSGTLTGSLGVTAPTSRASRKASLNGSFAGGLGSSWKLPNNFSFGTRHNVTVYSYQFDTANANGTSYNSPFGLSNGVNLGFSYKRFNLGTNYSLYYTKNYADTEITVQSVGANMGFKVTQYFSVAAGYSWRDRILTNNSLFDDDTSVTSFSAAVSF